MIVPLSQVPRELIVTYLREHWGLPEEVTTWKYYDARANAALENQERGLVWIKDDRPLGFLGLMPFSLAGEGELRRASWLVDWSLASKQTTPGMGVMLMRKAIQECGLALSLGGSSDTLSILPRMAALSVNQAGCLLRKRLRLGTAMERFTGTRLAALNKPLVQNLPLPAWARLSPDCRIWVEDGVSPKLEPLLQRLCPAPTSLDWRPCYDFEYVHWLVQRCPDLAAATILTDRAAALVWRLKRDKRFWRIVLLSDADTDSRALGALLQGARDMVYSRGGWELWTTVSHTEQRLLAVLRTAGYRLTPKRVPLFICAAHDNPPPRDFTALNYLDTDRGYRF